MAGLGLPAASLGPRVAIAQEAPPTQAPGEIQIPTLPVLSVQAIPSYGTVPLTVGFTVTVVDPANAGFVYYKWDFGDGHVSIVPPPFTINTYTNPGSYVVTVTAVTEDGRSATATTGIVVRPASQG